MTIATEIYGGLGKTSINKGGYVSYKDAYANGGDVVIPRTIVPVEQQASRRR